MVMPIMNETPTDRRSIEDLLKSVDDHLARAATATASAQASTASLAVIAERLGTNGIAPTVEPESFDVGLPTR